MRKAKLILDTPILFLVFNRLDTTKKVFEEIKKAKPKKLFIASDGPRKNKPGEKKIVEDLRKWVLDNLDWKCKVKTLFRDKNLGCKYAVSSAIDWFFENVEQGIILEDDCLPSQSFFRFCQELLEKYKNDERIMHISGTNVNSITPIEESYFFAYNYNVWGWATWKRAWNKYDLDIKKWPEIRKIGLIRRFSRNYIDYLLNIKGMNNLYNGKINTWDYQWAFACMINSALAIIPARNLIKNIGFGDCGTHTNTKSSYHSLNLQESGFPLLHNDLIVNREIYQKNSYKFFYHGRTKRKIIWIVKKAASIFGGKLGRLLNLI